MLQKCSAFWAGQFALESNLYRSYYCCMSLLWSQWNLKYSLFVLYWGFLLFEDIYIYFFFCHSELKPVVLLESCMCSYVFLLSASAKCFSIHSFLTPAWCFWRKRTWCYSLQGLYQLVFTFLLVICGRWNVLHCVCNSILSCSRACFGVKLANRRHMLELVEVC